MKSTLPHVRPVHALLLFAIAPLCGVLSGGCGGKSAPAPRAKSPPVQVSPAPAPQHPPAPTRPAVARRGTLFERLGGEAVIRAIVDDFVTRAAADPAVNFTRAGHDKSWQATPANLERLKERLVEFVVTAAGGPMQYRGSDMVTAHRGMGITNREFDALASHLAAAMQANDVPRREREEVLNVVASMRGAIVEAPDAPASEAPAEAPTAEVDASELPGTEASTPDAEVTDAVSEPMDGETAPEAAPDAAAEVPTTEDAPAPESTSQETPAPGAGDSDTPAPGVPETPAPEEAEYEPEL